MTETGTITTHEIGVDFVVEWQIPRFSTLREYDDDCYVSPLFSFGGERWLLGIAPNGRSTRGTSGHVDLELWKCSSGPSLKVSLTLSLKTAKGERHREEHVTEDFDSGVNWSHIFNRFVPRTELATLRSDLLPDDVLTVICTMRRTKSAGSDNEQNGCNLANQYVPSITPNLPTDFQKIKYFVKKMNGGKIPEHAYGGASSQYVVASTQRVEAYAQTNEVSTQTVEVATQTEEEKCAACASGASASSQEKKALQDYKQLFFEKEECDVTIRVKGLEFPAHKAILKARSPVLASTFRHDMKENATGILEIDDCDPSSFSDFVCFLYCADVQLICQSNVFDLFKLADKYQVLDLRSTCLEFVKSNLTVDTFCESIVLALRHSETELIKLCTDYFKKNAPQIIVTVKWQTFLAENPTESNELFIKLLVPNSS